MQAFRVEILRQGVMTLEIFISSPGLTISRTKAIGFPVLGLLGLLGLLGQNMQTELTNLQSCLSSIFRS